MNDDEKYYSLHRATSITVSMGQLQIDPLGGTICLGFGSGQGGGFSVFLDVPKQYWELFKDFPRVEFTSKIKGYNVYPLTHIDTVGLNITPELIKRKPRS